MQVQFSTDNNVEGHEKLSAHVRQVVESALSHSGAHITRVEVHLGDENGPKSGQRDKRCMMEARLEDQLPFAVTHHAATSGQAISGAADKLARLIESALGRRHDQKHRRTDFEPKPAAES